MKGTTMSTDEAAGTSNGVGRAGPPAFDTSKAHQARVYDYLLGGKDNFAADRAAVDAWLQVDPELPFTVRSNRAFLGRAVRRLTAEAGIRQFLDIGTGIPTAGNTHQVAQDIAPETRVVYVDYDPIVLAHARALLTSSESGATEYIDADVRDTGKILDQASQLLDFTQPVAITLLALLHAVPDADKPYDIVATLLDAVPSGSYLVISHAGSDLLDADKHDSLMGVADRMIQNKITYRSREQLARFFDGTDLVSPGLVRVEEWRPDPGTVTTERSTLWGGAGRKQ
jgi:S-adenosyl methyltransferase